ncbi:hypothetical protein VAPA_1c47470 [Variovorax paradoxus B4]|uniref:Uncharacterized protein n=1 Tax=Variovorax paradoxus B4 TaxID=1246301 RepID=T1XGW8_VARPD|nr:hypothetical protein VAPA_1c47470 [Variovorax paradoxus B4]
MRSPRCQFWCGSAARNGCLHARHAALWITKPARFTAQGDSMPLYIQDPVRHVLVKRTFQGIRRLQGVKQRQVAALVKAPMATPNCSTYGRSNCSRQDGRIMTIRA